MISAVCRAKNGEGSPLLAWQAQYSILEVRV